MCENIMKYTSNAHEFKGKVRLELVQWGSLTDILTSVLKKTNSQHLLSVTLFGNT